MGLEVYSSIKGAADFMSAGTEPYRKPKLATSRLGRSPLIAAGPCTGVEAYPAGLENIYPS
jgi:hypothetical protein